MKTFSECMKSWVRMINEGRYCTDDYITDQEELNENSEVQKDDDGFVDESNIESQLTDMMLKNLGSEKDGSNKGTKQVDEALYDGIQIVRLSGLQFGKNPFGPLATGKFEVKRQNSKEYEPGGEIEKVLTKEKGNTYKGLMDAFDELAKAASKNSSKSNGKTTSIQNQAKEKESELGNTLQDKCQAHREELENGLQYLLRCNLIDGYAESPDTRWYFYYDDVDDFDNDENNYNSSLEDEKARAADDDPDNQHVAIDDTEGAQQAKDDQEFGKYNWK